jgi:hypothetical protein
MLETIEEAAKNFCQHQIQESCKSEASNIQKRTFIAYIDIESAQSSRYRIYLAANKAFMQKVAKLFLEEDESDDETLQDMTLETANLIIGSAKVIAQEKDNENFIIETPHFVKIGLFDFDVDALKKLKTADAELVLAIKELNA